MKKTCLALAVLSTVSMHAFDAEARKDNWPNWYVGVRTDVSFISDTDLQVAGVNNGGIKFDTDYSLGASLGYRPYHSGTFLDHTRFELEYTYRDYAFEELATGTGPLNLDGSLKGQSFMANVFYDVPTGMQITPYVGAGLGWMAWDMDSSVLSVDDNDEVFAYQLMAGFYYSPDFLPDTDWGIGYRYLGAGDPTVRDVSGNEVTYEYESHNLELQARFRF